MRTASIIACIYCARRFSEDVSGEELTTCLIYKDLSHVAFWNVENSEYVCDYLNYVLLQRKSVLVTSYEILKSSDSGVEHSGILDFRILSIVWYSERHDVSETDPVSETSCSLG
jgi:hypothetical protein